MGVDVPGKVVVITGASRGLGAGMAEAMLAHGLRLGLGARSAPERWQAELADSNDVIRRTVDVTEPTAVDAFAAEVGERFGRIDLWINNAGVLEPVRFVRDLPVAALREHLAINLEGVLTGSRAYLRHLDATGHEGVLVNITSGAALKGYAGWAAYCAGKAAVDRLTECLQLEEQHRGGRLRAYAVAPGVIETDMQRTIRGKTPDEFPMVGKFLDLKQRDAFNSPRFVAEQLLSLAFDPTTRPDSVVLRLPAEKAT
jgi:benzil reductase ((S)-benzoin forming)